MRIELKSGCGGWCVGEESGRFVREGRERKGGEEYGG